MIRAVNIVSGFSRNRVILIIVVIIEDEIPKIFPVSRNRGTRVVIVVEREQGPGKMFRISSRSLLTMFTRYSSGGEYLYSGLRELDVADNLRRLALR